MSRPLRRRDFLKAALTVGGAVATVKLGGRWLIGTAAPERPRDPLRLRYLTPRHEGIVTAIALAMVGPAAEAACLADRWDPAAAFDASLDLLAADQASQILLALTLVEEWTWGLTGFSGLSRAQQRVKLAAWQTSTLAVQRSIWGVMHALTCSSFSGTEAGWEVMDYPGPCLRHGDRPGRAPGQTVPFVWDEAVP
jgi:hypothetical protein